MPLGGHVCIFKQYLVSYHFSCGWCEASRSGLTSWLTSRKHRACKALTKSFLFKACRTVSDFLVFPQISTSVPRGDITVMRTRSVWTRSDPSCASVTLDISVLTITPVQVRLSTNHIWSFSTRLIRDLRFIYFSVCRFSINQTHDLNISSVML